MLAAFRNLAGGFIAKIIMGMLIISFGVWGIGDMFRNAGTEQVVAVVDGDAITKRELENLISLLQQNYTQITAEVAAEPSFQMEVLNNLINDRLLNKESNRLGLTFSRDSLARLTGKNPLFQKEDGSFDRNRFLMTLRQNNHTEQSYLAKLADEVSGQFIQDTLQFDNAVSQPMLDLYYKVRNEQREADLIILNDYSLGPLDAPKEEELKQYYKDHAERFMQPEYRTMQTVYFDTNTLWKLLKLDPSDEELHALYEERKEAYNEPEKRSVEQWLFQTEEAATKARDHLNDFAKARTDLGKINATGLPKESSDIVFALNEGDISPAIKSPFGWNIFRVNLIHEPGVKSFNDVKNTLLADYRAENAEEEIHTIGNSIEDALAGGASLEEALKTVGLNHLPIETLGPLSSTNQTPKGVVQELSPLKQQMVDIGYTLEEGETSALSLSDESIYYLVKLEKVQAEQERPYDQVKDDVRHMVQEHNKTTALKKLATDTATSLQEAENLQAAIKDAGLKIYDSGKLKRTHDTITNASKLKDKILTSGFVGELFTLKPGDVTNAYPLPSGDYVVGILRNITPAKQVDETEMTALKAELQATFADEITQQYILHLRNTYQVEIKFDELFGSNNG